MNRFSMGDFARMRMGGRRGMRDGRIPYGPRRDRERRRRDYGEEYYGEDECYDEEDFARRGRRDRGEDYAHRGRRDYGEDYEEDYARRGYDRGQVYPFDVRGMFGRYDGNHYDPYYDFGEGEYLTDKELHNWMKDLMSEVEEKDKPMLKMENVIKRAKELGIQFDRFTEEELHVCTLMIFTDYGKTVGTASIDKIILMAKDFMSDPDSELKYGAKLCAYKRYVVDGE